MIELKLPKEDDEIWFIDAHFKNNVEEFYAEHGTVIAIKNNGDYVVEFYAGMFVLKKEHAFISREACEKYLYIDKLANDYFGNKGDK